VFFGQGQGLADFLIFGLGFLKENPYLFTKRREGRLFMFRPALALVAFLALSACGTEPWWFNGTAYVQVPVSQVSPTNGQPLSATKYGPVATAAPRYSQANPVPDNPVRFVGPNGVEIAPEELRPGQHIVYRPVGECTSPNENYTMHHMAGKFECAVLYDQATRQFAPNGYRQVMFRDWLGRGYAPNAQGVWVPAQTYNQMQETGQQGR
jgi:hypothetical protein